MSRRLWPFWVHICKWLEPCSGCSLVQSLISWSVWVSAPARVFIEINMGINHRCLISLVLAGQLSRSYQRHNLTCVSFSASINLSVDSSGLQSTSWINKETSASLAFAAVLTSLTDLTTINSQELISCLICRRVNPQKQKEDSRQGPEVEQRGPCSYSTDFQSWCPNGVPPCDLKCLWFHRGLQLGWGAL